MELETNRVEARWKGTIDLDREAIEAMTLDGMMFFVVGVRVEQMGATRMTKDGERVRKDILDVTDARVMLGDNRSSAVEFLAGNVIEVQQEVRDFSGTSARGLESPKLNDRLQQIPSAPEPSVEPEADEAVFVPTVTVDQEVRMAEDFEHEGVIGSLYDYKKSAPAPVPDGDGGPKVGKLPADDDTPETVKTVGEGRTYKDPALRKFMEAPV